MTALDDSRERAAHELYEDRLARARDLSIEAGCAARINAAFVAIVRSDSARAGDFALQEYGRRSALLSLVPRVAYVKNAGITLRLTSRWAQELIEREAAL